MENIKFISTVAGLTELEDCLPRPTNKFIPTWWKETPHKPGSVEPGTIYEGNIKTCPSFIDYFGMGYVVPMCADVLLSFQKEAGKFGWMTVEFSKWGGEDMKQVLDVMPYSLLGSNANFTFKTYLPWRVVTPPGYSILVLPMFFHFNKNFSAVPGIIDTDVHHIVNPDVMYHSNEDHFVIHRGEPFLQIIPFKRDGLSLEILEEYKIDNELYGKIKANEVDHGSKFKGVGTYLNNRARRGPNES